MTILLAVLVLSVLCNSAVYAMLRERVIAVPFPAIVACSDDFTFDNRGLFL